MDALQALTSRVSATGLTGPGPDEAALETILKAATRAADHGRLKPWRFIIIREQQREAFGRMLAEALKRRRPDTEEGMLKSEAGKPMRAPMIIVVAAHLEDSGKIPEIEQLLAVGAAAQNMMIAAYALGLGAMWRTGDSAYDPFVKEKLGLSPRDSIVGYIYLGTPARALATPPDSDLGAVAQDWRGAA
jgi:nitroreductase